MTTLRQELYVISPLQKTNLNLRQAVGYSILFFHTTFHHTLINRVSRTIEGIGTRRLHTFV